jgi:predicted DNA-binding transcriptional regulator YafY
VKRFRWGPEQRLEFIEFLLYWEGGLNRSDLIDRFSVSVPQASKDLATYRELAPENLEYDLSRKRYVSTSRFRPMFLKPNPDRYLAQLKAISDGILQLRDTWIAATPPTGVVPVPTRRIDAEVLRGLLRAIRDQSAVHVEYQSMSPEHPDPLWRWITPHAFGFDGLRWHVRAYCHRQNRFLDFVLGRLLAAAECGPAGAQPQGDLLWQEIFDVVLEPNPELTDGQRSGVARDYGMTDGKLVVPVRYALLYYFNKRLRFDVGEALDGPHERPVIIANRQDFDEALRKATTVLRPPEPDSATSALP